MFRVAVVGAGPAGAAATLRLLKTKGSPFRVNLFDRSLTPWGLVRTGVAPDHPEVKHTAQAWTAIRDYQNFQYHGGINVGLEQGLITLDELCDSHDALILCNGAYAARKLNITGSDSRLVLNAQKLVAFYNSDPFFFPDVDTLNLNGNIGIIGGGNVALDIARVLLEPKLLSKTDVNSLFLEKIKNVESVSIFVRRSPFDLPCTTRELRELVTLPSLDQVSIFGIESKLEELEKYILLQKSRKLPDRKLKRLLKLLAESEGISKSSFSGEKRVNFHFHHSPVLINEISGMLDVTFNHPKNGEISYQFSHLVESLGYNPTPLSHEIKNIDVATGTAVYKDQKIYMAGWALSDFRTQILGAKGVVGDSTDSARRATDSLLSDFESQKISSITKTSDKIIGSDWTSWERIDAEEVRRGKALGKSRDKISSFSEMLSL